MPRATRGRELGRKLVEAMGLPLDGCVGAEIAAPADGFATVVVRYNLAPEVLAKLAESLKDETA